MEEEQSVWVQIEEDQEDYQYFRQLDQEKLQQTLESIQKNCPLEKEQEV